MPDFSKSLSVFNGYLTFVFVFSTTAFFVCLTNFTSDKAILVYLIFGFVAFVDMFILFYFIFSEIYGKNNQLIDDMNRKSFEIAQTPNNSQIIQVNPLNPLDPNIGKYIK